MKRPRAGLVALAAAPFLIGCMGVQPLSLPQPADRSGLDVRGVVLSAPRGGEGERIEAREVQDVRWTDSDLAITAIFDGAGSDGQVETRRWPYPSLSAVLVRSVDVNKTSGIIAAVVLGVIGAVAISVNGQGEQGPLR